MTFLSTGGTALPVCELRMLSLSTVLNLKDSCFSTKYYGLGLKPRGLGL